MVVRISLNTILGFAGAPGSVPSVTFPFSCCEFMLIGKIVKRINHQVIIKTTIEPVIDIYVLIKLIVVKGLFDDLD